MTDSLKHDLLLIEQREDLSPDQKVNRVLHVGCAFCAAVATQPIPFADIILLTPLQGVMAWKIARIRGVKVSESEAGRVVGELLGLVGLGLGAQHGVITLYKLGLPFLGGLMTIPLVYGMTFAIGSVADAYFSARAQGREPSKEELRKLWKQAKKEGRRRGKQHRDESGDEHGDARTDEEG